MTMNLAIQLSLSALGACRKDSCAFSLTSTKNGGRPLSAPKARAEAEATNSADKGNSAQFTGTFYRAASQRQKKQGPPDGGPLLDYRPEARSG